MQFLHAHFEWKLNMLTENAKTAREKKKCSSNFILEFYYNAEENKIKK